MTSGGTRVFRWRKINPELLDRASRLTNPPPRSVLRYATDVMRRDEPVTKLVVFSDGRGEEATRVVFVFTDTRAIIFRCDGSKRGWILPYSMIEGIQVQPVGEGRAPLIFKVRDQHDFKSTWKEDVALSLRDELSAIVQRGQSSTPPSSTDA